MIVALLACAGVADPKDASDTVDSAEGDPLAAWEESVGLRLTTIPAGTFAMGSAPEEVGRMVPEGIPGSEYDREVQHTVTLTRAFRVGVYEVSRAEFSAWMGVDPSTTTACVEAGCPADTVTWSQAAALTNVLSEAAGVAPCYTCTVTDGVYACDSPADPYACVGYRLLTEAEWEYAARAGEAASFQGGGYLASEADIEDCSSTLRLDNGVELATLAWYCANATARTHPGGAFEANGFGLYDTTGNVHEWVNDRYDPTFYDLEEARGDDPVGPATGAERCRRGGAFSHEPRRLRLAYRGFHAGDDPTTEIGFRIARTSP